MGTPAHHYIHARRLGIYEGAGKADKKVNNEGTKEEGHLNNAQKVAARIGTALERILADVK
jgi:hypothetical protein